MNMTASPNNDLPDSSNDNQSPSGSGAGFDSSGIWRRLLFMLLFGFLYGISRVVVCAVVVVQFICIVFTSKANDDLLTFGQSLSTYTYQILHYLTFNSEERPFPIAEWPLGPPA